MLDGYEFGLNEQSRALRKYLVTSYADLELISEIKEWEYPCVITWESVKTSLIHIFVDEYNLKEASQLKYASKYVAQQMTSKLLQSHRDIFYNLAFSSVTELADDTFEELAHQVLANGGKFEVRRVESNEVTYLQLVKSNSITIFNSLEELKRHAPLKPDIYYRQMDDKFPTINSLLQSDKVLQISISPIKKAKLPETEIIKLMNIKPDGELNEYFVTRKENFQTMNAFYVSKLNQKLEPQLKVNKWILKIPNILKKKSSRSYSTFGDTQIKNFNDLSCFKLLGTIVIKMFR